MKAIFGFLIGLAGSLLLSGCQTESFTDPILGPVYTPRNVFRQTAQMPISLRRVAVLPVAYDSNDPMKVSGREALEPALRIGLGKAQRFECVPVSREQLNQWSGREKWTAAEQLPSDLLGKIKKELGCDAVLFSELTQYRPYSPIVIGWNFKLVEMDKQTIIWAVDEVLDGGEAPVSNAARLYQRSREKENAALSDSRQVLQSPQRFGQFSIDILLGTMPIRE